MRLTLLSGAMFSILAINPCEAIAGPISVFGSASRPSGSDSANCSGVDSCSGSGASFVGVSGSAIGSPGHIEFTSAIVAFGFNSSISVGETASASFNESVSYGLLFPSLVRLTFSATNTGGAPFGTGHLTQNYAVTVAGDPQQIFNGPLFQFSGFDVTETFSVDPSAGQFALTVQGSNSGTYSAIDQNNGMSSKATLDLTKIEFLDANGDPAPSVPEPSVFLLCGAGLLVGWKRLRDH